MARSSGAVIRDQEDALERLLADQPDGLSRDAIGCALKDRTGITLLSRTLLRRLEAMRRAERIETLGDGPGTRYRLRQRVATDSATEAPGDAPISPDAIEGDIPLSLEGQDIRARIRRPMVYRPPVGYHREWLAAYRPGIDWMLPEATRAQLHAGGRTPEPERPAGTYARDMLNQLLVDLSWASSRLEGNTYDRLDTQNLIEFGQQAEGKDALEAQMILNHKRAIEFLVEEIDRVGMDASTIRTLHAALSENLLGDPADEGRLRQRPVRISGTPYIPVAIPQVIEDAFRLFLDKAAAIPDPFEQAFFSMVHLPYLQPFADVNKRTSRLVANIPLIVANLCPLSFIDVPVQAYVDGTLGVYELRRVELLRDVFVWAYARSCARYQVVRDATAPPDPIRLRYREALDAVVRDVVRQGAAPAKSWLRAWGLAHDVPASDLDPFVERALAALLGLNEATAGRARLRPSEYVAWRARFAPPVG